MTEVLPRTTEQLREDLQAEDDRYWELQRQLNECRLARAAILNALKGFEDD